MSKRKHIVVAGNIGAGKSTLAKMLGAELDWQVKYENVEKNPYLADFYKDMHRWGFNLQVFFLNSRFEQIKEINAAIEPIIQDRSIYEDAFVFAKSLNDQGILTHRDYENYLRLFNSMMELVQPPDLLIYLKSDIPNLMENIQKRGRDYEKDLSRDYLTELNHHYEDWIGSYESEKSLTVDASLLDFVDNPKDFQEICTKVKMSLGENL